jgi:hypothetical protein
MAEAPSPLLVRLDASGRENLDVAAIAQQLPDPSTLPGDARVVVLPDATRGKGAWLRLVGRAKTPIPRAARCAALLVRGYVGIGAGSDGKETDAVWGRAP